MKKCIVIFGVFLTFSTPLLAADYSSSGFGTSAVNQSCWYESGEISNGFSTFWNDSNTYMVDYGVDAMRIRTTRTMPPDGDAVYYNTTHSGNNPASGTWLVGTGASGAGTFEVNDPDCYTPPTPDPEPTSTTTQDFDSIYTSSTLFFGFVIFYMSFFGLLFYFKRQTILK